MGREPMTPPFLCREFVVASTIMTIESRGEWATVLEIRKMLPDMSRTEISDLIDTLFDWDIITATSDTESGVWRVTIREEHKPTVQEIIRFFERTEDGAGV